MATGMLGGMSRPTGCVLTELERRVLGELLAPGMGGLDQLRLAEVPFVPEVRLHLAEDAIVLWARMEAAAGETLPPPVWAAAWGGGPAGARYVLDHPDIVAGRRVLDLAAGSGLVAVAAAMAGAASVTANDIDPYALAAVRLNAQANGVTVGRLGGDLLDGDGDGAEVLLAGDVFYSRAMSERVVKFFERATARGSAVIVGDPGRAYLPRERLELLASYRVPMVGALEDAEIKQTDVLRPRL
jgi:predicted nicotinamide N-methyase